MIYHPKLRPVDMQWVHHDGQQALLLRDPLGLSEKGLVVPHAIALLLSLCDGSRDISQLRAAFELRHGVALTKRQLEELVAHLDEVLLLDSPHFQSARARALAEYRGAPFRQPALAGRGYPADPDSLRGLLDSYVATAFDGHAPRAEADSICGLISPHIDYQRGGPIYARSWLPIAGAIAEAELVVVLGTDHAGGLGEITLTRQSYATPFGILPTARDVVDALAAAIGQDAAFACELNHRREHSIELAAVWLHYLLGEHQCQLVPILCGSFHHFVDDQANPASDERIAAMVGVLREHTASRRTLVVAAADLAHVGPAFGDTSPFDGEQRLDLQAADNALLAAASTGDPALFFDPIRRERDCRRVCGLPPIYQMLRVLEGASGEIAGYAQCPADDLGHSWVSIGGVVFRHR